MDSSMQDLNVLIDHTSSEEVERKYLTFLCDEQLFGIPIAHVAQIVGMQKITTIPESPDYMKGIINLRGNIIPVIDTRIRLKKQEIAYNERTCIIISTLGDLTLGFIVDGVDEVIHVEKGAIIPPPQSATDTANQYVAGVVTLEHKTILIINIQKMFTKAEIEQISQ